MPNAHHIAFGIIIGNFGNKTNNFIPCAYMSCYAKAFWSGVGLCICVYIDIWLLCVYKVFSVCVCPQACAGRGHAMSIPRQKRC